MVNSTVSLPIKWEKYLRQLADDHNVDVTSVLSELCTWAFTNPEDKQQFEDWLDDVFPPKGEAEDKERDADEEVSEDEQEKEDKEEEEAHEDRDYSEDRKTES